MGLFFSRLQGCSQSVTELLKRNSGWVFENPCESDHHGLTQAVLPCSIPRHPAARDGGLTPLPNARRLQVLVLGLVPILRVKRGPWTEDWNLAPSRLRCQWSPAKVPIAIGVLELRVLATNFRDYAIIFTQLEFGDEPFNTVELYSRTEAASQEAMGLFTKWSRGLGFLSQQQAQLQKDLTCAHKILP
ncbi:PREDICTED: epididymal-specific lipocalin-6 isoform X1 [Mandrillus leucophaeus]|uniref:epididymal-specific lipocalin-6 isoform X1 n=1 Tax=Mandrillus leucophaeus TaxID=9568 RepID=UPI0005F4F119|nr:PREDICTED: epididymal-specific lipocalin-6 isoform X1 [Mandrillus leucophaeus]